VKTRGETLVCRVVVVVVVVCSGVGGTGLEAESEKSRSCQVREGGADVRAIERENEPLAFLVSSLRLIWDQIAGALLLKRA